jgi:hypothetical protein
METIGMTRTLVIFSEEIRLRGHYYYYFFCHIYAGYLPLYTTKSFPRSYNFAAVLWLQVMAQVMLLLMINILYFYSSSFKCMCAVPNMDAFCNSSVVMIASCYRHHNHSGDGDDGD